MNVSILAAISLDGKIAQSSHQTSIEWTSQEDKRFFVTKTKEAGVLIMGRKTYETIGKPLPGRKIIVMTRNPERYKDVPGALEFSKQTAKEILLALANEGQEEVVIAGGAEIYRQFLEGSHVTDVYLTIEPIIFGEGVPFVEGALARFTLQSVCELGSGTVLLHYLV